MSATGDFPSIRLATACAPQLTPAIFHSFAHFTSLFDSYLQPSLLDSLMSQANHPPIL